MARRWKNEKWKKERKEEEMEKNKRKRKRKTIRFDRSIVNANIVYLSYYLQRFIGILTTPSITHPISCLRYIINNVGR